MFFAAAAAEDLDARFRFYFPPCACDTRRRDAHAIDRWTDILFHLFTSISEFFFSLRRLLIQSTIGERALVFFFFFFFFPLSHERAPHSHRTASMGKAIISHLLQQLFSLPCWHFSFFFLHCSDAKQRRMWFCPVQCAIVLRGGCHPMVETSWPSDSIAREKVTMPTV